MLLQYIKNDDIYLMKLLRKLLIIKRRFRQKLILINLHKWYINMYLPNKEKTKDIVDNKSDKEINKKINININNDNNIYKNKISNNKKLLYNLLNQNMNKK